MTTQATTMNTTNYTGIDYGNGQTNRDKSNGIRFGVIHQNEVLQAWADSSEPDYGNPSECECPKCKANVPPPENWGDTVECDCGKCFEVELPDCYEPIGFTYEKEGYEAQCGECGDIFVTKSPFFTYAPFCSPCAPGACYLMNPLDEPNDNNKAYCFGHDWFEDGAAPYPVYSMETGELIQPDKA